MQAMKDDSELNLKNLDDKMKRETSQLCEDLNDAKADWNSTFDLISNLENKISNESSIFKDLLNKESEEWKLEGDQLREDLNDAKSQWNSSLANFKEKFEH